MKSMISRIHLFENISAITQNRISEIAEVRQMKKGETLFSAEDCVDAFYAIVSGKVSLFRMNAEGHKRVFFILGEGELINEVVFDDLPVSVDCEVFEDAVLLKFYKNDFKAIMADDFDLTMKIMYALGRKQRRLFRQLKNTLPIGIEKKLAAKLWKLSKDYGVMDAFEGVGIDGYKKINLQISCTYLAYMLGTSRETISRAMKHLQTIDACKWEGKDLWVNQSMLLEYYRSNA